MDRWVGGVICSLLLRSQLPISISRRTAHELQSTVLLLSLFASLPSKAVIVLVCSAHCVHGGLMQQRPQSRLA